jgi:hypothetical protein
MFKVECLKLRLRTFDGAKVRSLENMTKLFA